MRRVAGGRGHAGATHDHKVADLSACALVLTTPGSGTPLQCPPAELPPGAAIWAQPCHKVGRLKGLCDHHFTSSTPWSAVEGQSRVCAPWTAAVAGRVAAAGHKTPPQHSRRASSSHPRTPRDAAYGQRSLAAAAGSPLTPTRCCKHIPSAQCPSQAAPLLRVMPAAWMYALCLQASLCSTCLPAMSAAEAGQPAAGAPPLAESDAQQPAADSSEAGPGRGGRGGRGRGRGRGSSGRGRGPRLVRPPRPDDAEARAMINALQQTSEPGAGQARPTHGPMMRASGQLAAPAAALFQPPPALPCPALPCPCPQSPSTSSAPRSWSRL